MAVVTRSDDPLVARISELVERVTGAQGRAALSGSKRTEFDHVRLASGAVPSDAHPAGPEPADTGSADTEPAGPEPAAMVVAHIGPDLVGYAHLSGSAELGQYAVELVIDVAAVTASTPGVPARLVTDALLDRVVDLVAADGGGALRLWAADATEDDDRLAAGHGFDLERVLIQMRCPLPLPRSADDPRLDESLPLRPFRPGVDEAAWLVVNNQAFAGHPEQGGWVMETILQREREPWFEPEGFLILEIDGRMWGSCWTKIHADTEPPQGEIYVIGVSPDAQGRGWGRALTRAGLEWLAGRGLTVGMLYVDGGNTAAVQLYRSMGFVDHHVDRAYLRPVPGQPAPTR